MSNAERFSTAIRTGDLEAVREHAVPGRLDEPLDPMGWTALTTAAAQGHADVVRWLLDAGARPDVVGDDTALTVAARRGYDAVVELLVGDQRVDVNHRDGRGFTALMSASLRGHDDVVAILLARDDLQANAADADGRTALIWAASAGHEGIARRLAADPRVAVTHAASDGVTAADAARDAGLADLASELERLGSEHRPEVHPSDLDIPPAAPPVPPDVRTIREPTRRQDRG